MPKQYEAMRDKFMEDGMDKMMAKKKAAMIYNSKPENKKHPVTPATRTKEKLKAIRGK
jgi:hypothetical protein